MFLFIVLPFHSEHSVKLLSQTQSLWVLFQHQTSKPKQQRRTGRSFEAQQPSSTSPPDTFLHLIWLWSLSEETTRRVCVEAEGLPLSRGTKPGPVFNEHGPFYPWLCFSSRRFILISSRYPLKVESMEDAANKSQQNKQRIPDPKVQTVNPNLNGGFVVYICICI